MMRLVLLLSLIGGSLFAEEIDPDLLVFEEESEYEEGEDSPSDYLMR